MANEQQVYQVKWTNDYDKFKYVSYNRGIDSARVDKIKRVIQTDGFLVPILANEDYFVIDGQHRLEAAKRLNVAVSYMLYSMSQEKLPIVISKLNSTAKAWSLLDYYYMWMDLGHDAYCEIGKIADEYNLPVRLAVWMATQNTTIDRGLALSKFKDGTFTMTATQVEKLREKARNFTAIRMAEKKFAEFPPSFLGAIGTVVGARGYNHKIMMEALRLRAGELMRATNKTDYLIQFGDMYNRVATKKERIKFAKT